MRESQKTHPAKRRPDGAPAVSIQHWSVFGPCEKTHSSKGRLSGAPGSGWSYSFGGFFLFSNGVEGSPGTGFFIGFGAPAPGGPRFIK